MLASSQLLKENKSVSDLSPMLLFEHTLKKLYNEFIFDVDSSSTISLLLLSSFSSASLILDKRLLTALLLFIS
jgi:hypothetical protein